MGKFKDLKDFLMVHDEPRQVACYRGHGKHHWFRPYFIATIDRVSQCRHAPVQLGNSPQALNAQSRHRST